VNIETAHLPVTLLRLILVVLGFLGTPGSVRGIAETCGDQRDVIIREYSDLRLDFVPGCVSFTKSVPRGEITFRQLNSGDYDRAIIHADLLSGLHCIRKVEKMTLKITSGYRNPKHNVSVYMNLAQSSKLTLNSWHTRGDAADLGAGAPTWESLASFGHQCKACVEPLRLSTANHVHVDWRSAPCPSNW
jgi:hypothetical protein